MEPTKMEQYVEIYDICVGTQEFFWNQVVEKLNMDEITDNVLAGDFTMNKELAKRKIKQVVDQSIGDLAMKTSVVLMGILLKVANSSPQELKSLSRFDSRLQELLEDYIVTDTLVAVLDNTAKRGY